MNKADPKIICPPYLLYVKIRSADLNFLGLRYQRYGGHVILVCVSVTKFKIVNNLRTTGIDISYVDALLQGLFNYTKINDLDL